MDSLTHGLLGAVVGALPLPRWFSGQDYCKQATRAGLLVGVIAGELPDLDYVLPAGDAVLHALKAHRGLTHALIAAPVVALVAALLVKLVFRRVRLWPLYFRALVAVLLAHLLPDLWTGWGTRLWLPFDDRRLALDWTMVLDPWFTLPLLVGAGWATARRERFRRALLLGAAVAGAYLLSRVALAQHLTRVVQSAYPRASSLQVFPAPLTVLRWRYVARLGASYAAGSVALGESAHEEARPHGLPTGPLPEDLIAIPTVHEALAWARFPVVRVTALGTGESVIRIADLRYHLRGQPTLTFVIRIGRDGRVTRAELDRGGSARSLLRRWWQSIGRFPARPPRGGGSTQRLCASQPLLTKADSSANALRQLCEGSVIEVDSARLPPMIKLYGHPVSTCTRKVLTVLSETNTPYEMNVIDFSKGEHKQEPHLSRQPFGQIPTIDDDGFKLYESRAICRYLSAKSDNALIPKDAKQRALMDQWLSVEQSNFSPSAMKFIYHYVFKRPQEPAVLEAATAMLETCFSAMSVPLEKNAYLAGEQFTIGDIGYMPYVEYVMTTPAKATVEKYPRIMAWWERVSERPTWRKVAGRA